MLLLGRRLFWLGRFCRLSERRGLGGSRELVLETLELGDGSCWGLVFCVGGRPIMGIDRLFMHGFLLRPARKPARAVPPSGTFWSLRRASDIWMKRGC